MQSFWLIILFWVQLTAGNSDFNALLEVKKGIRKDSGLVLESWNAKSLDSDECPLKWYGVVCSDGNVESIMLNDAGLLGDFDFKSIASLKGLRNLSISNNQLTGSILDVAQIGSLQFLDVSRNSFQGLIPSNFTQLKNLVSVNLSTNNFDGVVPSGFGNLKKLKYLDLHSNKFSGDVMKLISELGGLVVVDLSCNKFGGHLDIGLGRSSFISSVQYLNVSNNVLTGELFAHDGMPYFDSLEVFDASNNLFSGAIPSFNFVVSLRVLRLGNNQLSGALPEALIQDSSMVISELDLSLNQLDGPVGSITSTSLRNLNLSSNQLSGSLPLRIGHCVTLDLSNNKISGNLSRIKYWGNYVEVIRLTSNSLTGPIPEETSQFLRLTSLELSNNSLQGSLPPTLGSYPELKVIDLGSNFLSGFILPSLFNSTRLTDLNLSHNNFSGTIPLQAAAQMNNLGTSTNFTLLSVDLSHNFLRGDFPMEISNFRSLLYLDLSSNNFQGSIPHNLSDQLIGLNVSYNNLSGIVPENLRRFPDTAFHPGNLLLTVPLSSSSYSSKQYRHSMNSSVLAFILAGSIGGALVVVLLFLVIYFRFHMKEKGKKSHMGKNEFKENKDRISSLHSTSSSCKTVEPSIPAPSSGQGVLKSSPTPELSTSTSMVSNTNCLGPSDPMRRHDEITSPASMLSPSNTSSSNGHNLFCNLSPMKIGSPDKLAGNLHLFNGSLVFTAEQLSCAPAEVIGRSCHGMLYRATLHSGRILVVKRLKDGLAKERKEFAREAKRLANFRHPNLVSLQGYYWGPRDHEKLIISNYINSPCLGIYLQGRERSQVPSLTLGIRLKAAQDVAQCLDYLHNEKAIPHGNLKSTNILIDPLGENVLVTDYSLHRLLTPAGTADQVFNAGALGYLPPEFISSSKPCPSIKSDVYAFGVTLLELVSGRSSAEIVSVNQGAVDLTDWVRMMVAEQRASDCFDKVVLGNAVTEIEHRAMDRMLQIALRCVLPAPERPDIKTVFDDLLSIELQR